MTPKPIAKVVIIGSSCSGKTTIGKRLAESLSTNHVELDRIFWKPNWEKSLSAEFKAKVENLISKPSWVVDGDYRSHILETVWSKADTIVWLNPPFYIIMYRFFVRTFRRFTTREELWDGCRENVKNAIFQKDSLLLYILRTHRRRMKSYTSLMQDPPYPDLKFVRLRSNNEIENFFQRIEN